MLLTGSADCSDCRALIDCALIDCALIDCAPIGYEPLYRGFLCRKPAAEPTFDHFLSLTLFHPPSSTHPLPSTLFHQSFCRQAVFRQDQPAEETVRHSPDWRIRLRLWRVTTILWRH